MERDEQVVPDLLTFFTNTSGGSTPIQMMKEEKWLELMFIIWLFNKKHPDQTDQIIYYWLLGIKEQRRDRASF
jgi:hypothetical protein